MRKPHSNNAGYVAERKSHHPKLTGHFVIYDRDADPSPGIDCDYRWIVMFESADVCHACHSAHVGMPSLRSARELLKAVCSGSDEADFGQHDID